MPFLGIISVLLPSIATEATFVSAVAVKLGYTDIIPTECGCGPMIELFKEMGCWKESDSRKPNAGDIIFYDWDDSGYGDDCSGGDGGDDCSSRSSGADSNHSSMVCANSGMDDTNSRMATPSHNTNCMQGQLLHPTSQTSRLHT